MSPKWLLLLVTSFFLSACSDTSTIKPVKPRVLVVNQYPNKHQYYFGENNDFTNHPKKHVTH